MTVDKQFIKVYDMIFNWILETQGLDQLIKFWKYLAPTILEDMVNMAKKDGLKGCADYWYKTLTEEKARFILDVDPNILKLNITECPAIKLLNQPKCPEYCRHCAILYAAVLEPLGYVYSWKRTGGGRCEIRVEKRVEQ